MKGVHIFKINEIVMTKVRWMLVLMLLFGFIFSPLPGIAQNGGENKVTEASARNIVLVPGFFNSLVPALNRQGDPWKQPYFSRDIIQGLTEAGYKTWVVDNLNPVGGIEENGKRLLDFLTARTQDFGDQPVVLVGHSAGGLYALYAIAHGDFDIAQFIAVNTPFRGLKFLTTLEKNHIPIKTIAAPFCLENLIGLNEENVRVFINSLSIRKPLRIDVFASYQASRIDTWNYRSLSAPMNIFQALANEASDGIVTLRSAWASKDLSAKNSHFEIYNHPQTVDLEHWEMAADYRFFNLAGVWNTNALRRAQRKAYVDILKSSGIPPTKQFQTIQEQRP
ncbi:MAG: alpha/beta hydrolase [Bdellovibrionaceae bacterium]|nr:alpha/beta hydrolase [Pseudobdellovibrionaceae bacterium]